MESLELIALMILVIIFSATYLPKSLMEKISGMIKRSTLFTFFYFFISTVIYPFFIQAIYLLLNQLYGNDNYPSNILSFDKYEKSIFFFDKERWFIFLSGDAYEEGIVLSILFLILVITVYFFVRRVFLNPSPKRKSIFIGLLTDIKQVNFKVLIVSALLLTIIIKPIYTSIFNPTLVDSSKCVHLKTYNSTIGKWNPCENYEKEPAKLIDYFSLSGDAGMFQYRKIDLILSFIFALTISFAVMSLTNKIIPHFVNKPLSNNSSADIEAQIRILKEMQSAGVITEEEYKIELKKIRDRII